MTWGLYKRTVFQTPSLLSALLITEYLFFESFLFVLLPLGNKPADLVSVSRQEAAASVAGRAQFGDVQLCLRICYPPVGCECSFFNLFWRCPLTWKSTKSLGCSVCAVYIEVYGTVGKYQFLCRCGPNPPVALACCLQMFNPATSCNLS